MLKDRAAGEGSSAARPRPMLDELSAAVNGCVLDFYERALRPSDVSIHTRVAVPS